MTTGEASAAAEGPEDRFRILGTVIDRKFRVDRLVAEGGFGVVYQGSHLTLEKPIAIKVLKTPPDYNDAARAAFAEKFALEAKTIARISHPSIVQVLDFGVSAMPSGEQAPWMVLEWLTGHTLEEALNARRGGSGRSPAEALTMLRPVLEGLAYAHDEGIAHRDIKPANIMVVETRRGRTLRLMDFGIAKLMDPTESAGTGVTRTRSVMNAFSPQYAAPEQISSTRTGPWTDVHALGLILTEVLTDHDAFVGQDMTALFGEILSPQRPTPKKYGLDVGPWEAVIARALAVKPDDRFRNAGELLSALEAAVPSEVRRSASAVVSPSRASGDASGPWVAAPTLAAQSIVPATAAKPVGATTLRASVIETHVVPHAPPARRGAMLAGVAALGVLVAVGAALRGRSAPSPAPSPPVLTVRAATGSPAGSNPVAAPVAPLPAAPPAAPVVPVPVVAPSRPAAPAGTGVPTRPTDTRRPQPSRPAVPAGPRRPAHEPAPHVESAAHPLIPLE